MNVDQLLCAAGPVDAVTNQALAWRRQFTAWGWGGADYAEVLAPGMGVHDVKPLKAYRPRERTLVHYSGFAPELEKRVGDPFMLLSHNVTPPRYFWELEPGEAVNCALAPQQLAALAARAKVVAGVSAYNVADFPNAAVVPILFNNLKGSGPGIGHGPPTVLFVGRLAPHKRQDLVVRAFALYRKRHAPDARLVLVGVPISPDYDARLRRLADELAPGAVTFASGIPTAELHDHYRSATAFLCLSEHEGFCIPLLEAMSFGVPVIARAVGGIPEVLGDAGVLLEEGDDLPVVAELLRLAPELRDTLRPRAEARLEHYAADRVATLMRDHLTSL